MAPHTYTETQRKLETCSLILYLVLQTYSFIKIEWNNGFLLLIPTFLGYLGADFVSGFLHWAADTWGKPTWPFFGNSLIRTFREHHIDPMAITRHDFIETNGAITLIAVPMLIFANACRQLNFFPGAEFVFTMLTIQCFFGAFTSQIHKWSHLPKSKVPKIVQFLQKNQIILSPQHHGIHHRFPFDRYYCINSGSLNWVFYHIKFFRILEKIISTLTGAIPREDDLKNISLPRSRPQNEIQI